MTAFQNGLLNEQPVSLTVNGRGLATVMMLRDMAEEFAVGYLTTEGIVSYADIESVMQNDAGVSVLTKNPFKVLLPKKSVLSGCGGTEVRHPIWIRRSCRFLSHASHFRKSDGGTRQKMSACKNIGAGFKTAADESRSKIRVSEYSSGPGCMTQERIQ